MGCYNISCSISYKQIKANDKIVMIFGAGFSLPFFGLYDEYGGIILDSKNPANISALKHWRDHLLKNAEVDTNIISEMKDFLSTVKANTINENQVPFEQYEKWINYIKSNTDIHIPYTFSKETLANLFDMSELVSLFIKLNNLKEDIENLDWENLNETVKHFNNYLKKFSLQYNTLGNNPVVKESPYYQDFYNDIIPVIIAASVYHYICDYDTGNYYLENKDIYSNIPKDLLKKEWTRTFLQNQDLIRNYYCRTELDFALCLIFSKTYGKYRLNSSIIKTIFTDEIIANKIQCFLKTQESENIDEFITSDNQDFSELNVFFLNHYLIKYYHFIHNINTHHTILNEITPTGQSDSGTDFFDKFYKELYKTAYNI